MRIPWRKSEEPGKKFYNEITEHEKAEFINGEIIIHSPVKKAHNRANGLLFSLLSTYVNLHDLGFVGVEKIMISLTRNDYEPDICFFKEDKAQHFTEDQVRFPSPDLVVEVLSGKTEKLDRGIKFNDYQAHGVEEYWIIHPVQEVVEQYRLIHGEYELILKSKEGMIDCKAVDGFHIPIRAIFDAKENLKAMAQIMKL